MIGQNASERPLSGSAKNQAPPNTYVLQVGDAGFDRLEVSEQAYGRATPRFVQQLCQQVPRAWPLNPLRMAIVACGPGSQIQSLAGLIPAKTALWCSDISVPQLEMARRTAARLGRADVHFDVLNIETHRAEQVFDIVQCRFTLVHLKDPGRALQHMWSMVAPGGTLLSEEHSIAGIDSSPANPAIDQARQWMAELGQARGVDFCLGDRLPELFAEAGIPITAFHTERIGYASGRPKRLLDMSLREGRGHYEAAGIASGESFSRICDALGDFAARPDTTVFLGSLSQAAAIRDQILDPGAKAA